MLCHRRGKRGARTDQKHRLLVGRTRESKRPVRVIEENLDVEARWDCCPQHAGVLARTGSGRAKETEEVHHLGHAEDGGEEPRSSEKAETSRDNVFHLLGCGLLGLWCNFHVCTTIVSDASDTYADLHFSFFVLRCTIRCSCFLCSGFIFPEVFLPFHSRSVGACLPVPVTTRLA